MEPTPLRIAVIGPGGIADDQHGPALSAHPGARLWSVVSRSRERAEAFARKHGAASPHPAFTSLDDCLRDDDLDAVLIATPDRMHEAQAVAAARAGKHVLIEKPMSTDPESCGRMIRACAETNVTLAVAYHHRWHAGIRAVRDLVRRKTLGRLRHMRVHWTFAAPDGGNWRSSPDTGRWWSLAANGTHCLDLVRWMFCETEGEIQDLRALSSNAKFGSPHDETALVLFRFASGATAEICVSVQFASDSQVEIYGDGGSIRMEGVLGRHGAGEIRVDGAPLAFEPRNPFLGELDDFIRAIRDGRPPEVGGTEGKRNVSWLVRVAEATGTDRYS